MTDQEFESLYAQHNRPSLGGRLLQGAANIPSSIAQGVADIGTAAVNLGMPEGDELPTWSQHIPQPFDIPAARNWQEVGVDIVPNIASLLPQILVPEMGVANLLSKAGMTTRAAGIGGAIFGNALPGLAQSPTEAAGLGTIGGLQRATDFLPRSARLPLSLLAGAGAGALDYSHSNDLAQAGALGVLNAALPFLPRQIELPSQPTPFRPTIEQPQLTYPDRPALPMYGTPYGERAAGAEFAPPRPGPVEAGPVTFDFESMRVPPTRQSVVGAEEFPFSSRFSPQQPIEAEFFDLTPQQRLLMAPEEIATLQKQVELPGQAPQTQVPLTPSPSGVKPGRGPKITKDDYDILDKFTEKNRLRVVPEKKEGFVIFESLRDDPKIGKVRVEVPEGTTVAQANKLLKEARKNKIATLQSEVTEGRGTVPFADVPSRDIDVSKFSQQVERGQQFKSGVPVTLHDPSTGMKRTVDYDRMGRTQQEALETIAGTALGAAYGYSKDDENRIRGLMAGAVAGAGIPQSLRFLANPRSKIAEAQKLGIFAGPMAKGFAHAQDMGDVFKGLDEKPRFEISDLASKFKLPKGALGPFKLEEVVDHPELFANYPELKNVKIIMEKMGKETSGKVDLDGNIHINSDMSAAENHSSLLHEIQHKVQRKEGFASGGSEADFNRDYFQHKWETASDDLKELIKQRATIPVEEFNTKFQLVNKVRENAAKALKSRDAYEYYRNLAGEVEAREVQSRQTSRLAGVEPPRPFLETDKDKVVVGFRPTQEFDQTRPGFQQLKNSTAGFIDGEVLRLVGSTIGGAAIGGVVDDENRLRGMVLGAMLGGGFSKYGPELLDWTTGARGSLKGKGFEDLAREAARGSQGTMPKLARQIEKLFTSDPKIKDLVTKAGGETALAAEQVGDALNLLREMGTKLNATDNKAILDFFQSGDIATLQKNLTNADAQAAAITARQVATKLQQIVTEGMNDTRLKKKIEDSFDSYLTRAYKIFNDPKYVPSTIQIEAVKDELMRAFPTMGEDIARAKIQDYVHETLTNRALLKTAKAAYSGSRSTTGQSLDEILKTRKDLRSRPAFRDLLGEYTNPVEMMAATASKLLPAARVAKFYDDVADTLTNTGNKFTYVQEEWQKTLDALRSGPKDVATLQKIKELEAYVPVGESERYGKLSNRMVHRRVRDQLSSYDSPWGLAENNVIRGMVEFHTIVKTGRTVLNPITVLRNILTVPFFSAISDAGGPGHWKDAYKLIKAKGKEYQEMMKHGILSADQVKGEFFKDIGYVLRGNPDASLAQKIFDKGIGKAMDFYRVPDLVVRASSYLRAKAKYLKQGLSEEEAMNRAATWVNRYTMNYDAIVPGIRAARQLPFANIFLSYTSEIMRIAKNLAMDGLGKGNSENQIKALALLAGIPTMFAGAQFASEQSLSKSDQEEWERVKSLMPAHNRNNFMVVTGRMPDGAFKYYNVSPLFIADDWGKMFRGVISGDGEAVAANNPFIGWENTPLFNVITEAVSGRDRRTGQRIDGITGLANEIRKEVLPPLLGGYALDNIGMALTPNEKGQVGITDPQTGRRYGWETILNEFGLSAIPGARTSYVQPSYLQRAAQFQAQEKIQALQSEMRKFQRSDVNANAKAAKRERIQKEIESILNDLKTKLGMAQAAL